MTVYAILLACHSLNRWAVVALALAVVVRGLHGAPLAAVVVVCLGIALPAPATATH